MGFAQKILNIFVYRNKKDEQLFGEIQEYIVIKYLTKLPFKNFVIFYNNYFQ